MKFLFRVDASLSIGTGHVMRCLALARKLKKNNCEIEFISRKHEGNIIKKIRENPLYRALRCDKITYALLEETLRTYYDTTTIKKENLTWNLFLRRPDYLENLGLEIINKIPKSIQTKSGIQLLKSKVEAGSGSLPVKSIESWCLIFNSNYFSAKKLHVKFLNNSPSILGFIHNKKFRIDLKAILVNDTENIIKAILDIYN